MHEPFELGDSTNREQMNWWLYRFAIRKITDIAVSYHRLVQKKENFNQNY
jgi:hypothetical protein